MVDEGFREALFRAPGTVLAEFDLAAEEHAAVMSAIRQSRERSQREQAQALHAALIKRWAT
jgi:hypothetical protein